MMWVWSLNREEPLEKEMATHSSVFAWKIPWTEDIAGYVVHWAQKSWTRLSGLTKQYLLFVD